MPDLTALATPESERRLREFWVYGGDRFPLTGPEWRFVTTLVAEAPALSGVGASFNWGYMTVSIGQLGEGLREGPIERRIMIAALLAYGTLPQFLWFGCGGPLLEFLPRVGAENLNVLNAALLQLVEARAASTAKPSAGGSKRRRKSRR
jgi:hypothetical protein